MGTITIILGIVFFFLILGLIVVVHEFGHLIVAKRNGVYCHEFSIGMGPKLFQFFEDKSGTKYNVRAIPLGGFVSIAGEDSGVEADEKIPADQKFDNKSPWKRFKILVAGASMNFILGLLIFALIFFFIGAPVQYDNNEVYVADGSPAEQAGIVTGDKITKISGNQVNNYDEIANELNKTNDEVNLTFEHEGQEENVNIIKNSNSKIGISNVVYKYKFNPFYAIYAAFKVLIGVIILTFVSIGMLFTGQASVSDLSGPVGIAAATTGVTTLGVVALFKWTAFLSFAIGITNLLPIPALDGGRIVFIIIEVIIGKPVPKNVETIINNVVFFGLIFLIIFVSFSDVTKLIKFFN